MFKIGSKTAGIIGLLMALAGVAANHGNVIGNETAQKVGLGIEITGVLVTTLFGGAVLRTSGTRSRRAD